MLIPQAILDSFGGREAAPFQIAMAVGSSPTSSAWRDLAGSAIAYGLTDGGYNSNRIALTDLGRRCVAPTIEGDDVRAKCEAALRPQILRQFFERYDRAKFPDDKIAKNVLQHDFNVPSERVSDVVSVIKDNGSYVGILHTTKTGPFVSLNNPEPSTSIVVEAGSSTSALPTESPTGGSLTELPENVPASSAALFRVFISHSKNMDVVDQVKDVLGLYDIDHTIAVEEETTAIPVPDKVIESMRRCQAGIMVVTADEQSKSGENYTVNNNVLIEIGAAFVLYNKRVVLLWDKRVKVPSNLSGLYRCEFEGTELSFAVGTKLAKSVKAFRDS